MTNSNNDIIIEFINIGNFVKVTAVCARTGREVSVVGDPKAGKRELQALAIKKLNYVMNEENKAKAETPKRGIVI